MYSLGYPTLALTLEKEGKHFHQVLSLTPPLIEGNSESDWSKYLSTEFLDDKCVLAPGGFGTEAAGILKRRYTYKSTDWEMSIDLEAAEVERGDSKTSFAGFDMYFLSKMPEAD